MNDEENVDPPDDNSPQTVDEKKGKEEPVDDGKVNPEKSTQNTYDDHTDANAKSGHRKGLPICVICRSKCANKVDLAKHIEKYHKRSRSNSCPHCYENCKTKKSLNNHIDKNHYDIKGNTKNICVVCGIKFDTERHIKNMCQKYIQKQRQKFYTNELEIQRLQKMSKVLKSIRRMQEHQKERHIRKKMKKIIRKHP